jgi:hypothetical protein
VATFHIRGRVVQCVNFLASLPFVVLVGFGLAARLAADVVFTAQAVDTYEFGVIAENVLLGRGFSYFAATPSGVVIDQTHAGIPLPSAFMPPLYVGIVLVASVGSRLVEAGPDGVVWFVRMINLVLACVTMVGLARLMSVMCSARAARLAVLGFAIYPAFVYQATQVSASNAYLAVEVMLLAQCALLVRLTTPSRLLLVGLLAGLLALLRAEAIVIIVALAIWLAYFAGGGELRRRTRLAIAAAFLGIALLIPFGWLVRNSLVFDRPIATITTTGGLNLWIGNHSGASGSQKYYSVPPPLAARVAALPASPNYELNRDAVFSAAASGEMASKPLETVARDGKKLLMVLTVDPYDPRSLSPAYLGGYTVLVVLGGCGAITWLYRKSRSRDGQRWKAYGALLGGWLALSLAVPSVFFALARFRLPLEVILLMGAAVFVSGWAERTERDSRRRPSHDVVSSGD